MLDESAKKKNLKSEKSNRFGMLTPVSNFQSLNPIYCENNICLCKYKWTT